MRLAPVLKELVLVGGGHSHVHVLKSFGMRPMPGVRVTIIARDVETPYSGMLPGFVAGHYTRDECHIDLRPLARFAQARFLHDEAVGLDLARRRVECRLHPSVRYDIVSLDIGSAPKAGDVIGAEAATTPVKPIARFAERWLRIVDRVRAARAPLRFLTVGGGAAGVELTLAMRHRLHDVLREEGRDPELVSFTLATRDGLLASHNRGVQARFRRILAENDILVLTDAAIVSVVPGSARCADGREIRFDEALWVTQASAAAWLATTGLPLDSEGFVRVDATLRSLGDDAVFAAGDVAANRDHPRPKAGVFAVRQGPPLAENLRRALADEKLLPFVPQRKSLSLIGTGDKYAVASRGGWSLEGAAAWRLKEWIDRRWIAKYQRLPEMPAEAAAPATMTSAAMRCGGCGAKVPSPVLTRVLDRLAPKRSGLVALGLEAPDDAAVMTPPPGQALLQTVDFFRAFISDPYVFGRVAANHALGDIYAMGGEPLAALAIATVPHAAEAIVEEDLFHMLRGGAEVLEAAGAVLVGGHSGEASELALGFSVTGTASERTLRRKSGLRPGDRLILTKPLGTGVLFAADMQGKARGRWIEAALPVMQQPAADSSRSLHEHGALASTDVTGFGLLGHLLEMLRASNLGARLDPERVPALDGALELLETGIVSSLHAENARSRRAVVNWPESEPSPRLHLLFDPQTAGGLLAGVPEARAGDCLASLNALGYPDAAIVGIIDQAGGAGSEVLLTRIGDPSPTARPAEQDAEPDSGRAGSCLAPS